MAVQEKILKYLSVYGKENKFRIARALKIDAWEVTKALSALEKEGRIELKGGRAILVKGEKPITAKIKKREMKPKIDKKEPEEDQAEEATEKEEEIEERPEETETTEEISAKEEEEEQPETPIEETEKVSEEPVEERIGGTVKFFNQTNGFGFIRGDDGKEYYVHKNGLKEGVVIDAGDKVSFKVVQGDRGPKAEEVEWISQA